MVLKRRVLLRSAGIFSRGILCSCRQWSELSRVSHHSPLESYTWCERPLPLVAWKGTSPFASRSPFAGRHRKARCTRTRAREGSVENPCVTRREVDTTYQHSHTQLGDPIRGTWNADWLLFLLPPPLLLLCVSPGRPQIDLLLPLFAIPPPRSTPFLFKRPDRNFWASVPLNHPT